MENSIYNYDYQKPIGIIYSKCCGDDCCDSEKIISKINAHTSKEVSELHDELRNTDISNAVKNVIARIESAQNDINSNMTTSKNEILADIDESRYAIITDNDEKHETTDKLIKDESKKIIDNDNSNAKNLIDLIETVHNSIITNHNRNKDEIISNDDINKQALQESIQTSKLDIINNSNTNKNSIIANEDTNRDMVINHITDAKNNVNNTTNSLLENFKTWLRNNMTWHT